MSQPLAEAIFWIAALSCAVAEIMILRSSFASLRGDGSRIANKSSRGAELSWALIPAAGLIALLFFTWQRVEARESRLMDHSHTGPPMNMSAPTR
jgi:heme/copper-type cytochrome/quinol oxidase subunit 2